MVMQEGRRAPGGRGGLRRAGSACGARASPRARAPGVGEERRRGRLRGLLHLTHGDRRRAGGGHAGSARVAASSPRGSWRRPCEEPPRRAPPRRSGVRAKASRLVIVRWGLESYPDLLAELGIQAPLVDHDTALGPPRPPGGRSLLRRAAACSAGNGRGGDPGGARGRRAGRARGGSAIDTAKAVSVATGLPLVSIPTTYSGAEWTRASACATRSAASRSAEAAPGRSASSTTRSSPGGLSEGECGGTALNALAHCAEALYVAGRNPESDAEALARRDSSPLASSRARRRKRPRRPAASPRGRHARGRGLAGAGLALGHAMAQALGGRYGISHGALNAVCLPCASLQRTRRRGRDRALRRSDRSRECSLASRRACRVGWFERLRTWVFPSGWISSPRRRPSGPA